MVGEHSAVGARAVCIVDVWLQMHNNGSCIHSREICDFFNNMHSYVERVHSNGYEWECGCNGYSGRAFTLVSDYTGTLNRRALEYTGALNTREFLTCEFPTIPPSRSELASF